MTRNAAKLPGLRTETDELDQVSSRLQATLSSCLLDSINASKYSDEATALVDKYSTIVVRLGRVIGAFDFIPMDMNDESWGILRHMLAQDLLGMMEYLESGDLLSQENITHLEKLRGVANLIVGSTTGELEW